MKIQILKSLCSHEAIGFINIKDEYWDVMKDMLNDITLGTTYDEKLKFEGFYFKEKI